MPEQVAVALRLSPAVAVEEVLGRLGVDVGDAVFVPEDFGALLRGGGEEGREEDERKQIRSHGENTRFWS